MENLMREVLENELVVSLNSGDTTVLSELLGLLPIHLIHGALSDSGQQQFKALDIHSKPFAISTSDGHDEDWTYYDSERDAYDTFIYMQGYESDIHLFKLTLNNEYEVIDSWFDESEI